MAPAKGPIKALLLEHETKDARLVQKALEDSGIPGVFTRVETRDDFLRELKTHPPDLILSDYALPHYSGLTALADAHRVCPNVPFIFVSWEIHEQSVIEALREGATDYVFKENLHRLTLSVIRALRESEERMALDRAHLSIKKSEEYFRSLIENASDIITVLDAKGTVCYASPSVTKVLGYSPEEFIGRNILDFVHTEDAENAAFVFAQTEEKKDLSLEFRFRDKKGSWRGLEAIGRTIRDETGEVKTIVNSRDITDRILEQEALRESILRYLKTQTELQRTQQKIIQQERLAAIGQMSSGIAHDFSNALMPVLGFSEILLTHPDYMTDLERVRKYLQMINTSARDAMHIVGGLREFYRTKEKAENLQPVDLNALVEQVVLMTQPKWKEEMSAKGVSIHVQTRMAPLPSIVGNESALREALTNLIFNAVDAMPQGGEIKFSSRSEKGTVVLEIADTGMGMDEETRKRCFEPFFSTKGKGGTGLGLSMVYGVVTRHQGTIDIKSEAGKGTTIAMHLPVDTAAAGGEGTKKKPVTTEPLSRKISVLIVDDEPLIREVLREYLSGDGHTVDSAADGTDAWSLFQTKKFDLVITDRAMPQMSGDQLAEKIKQVSPQTPVIMLTGFGELMKAKGEMPKGIDHLLSKPLTFETYREAVALVVTE